MELFPQIYVTFPLLYLYEIVISTWARFGKFFYLNILCPVHTDRFFNVDLKSELKSVVCSDYWSDRKSDLSFKPFVRDNKSVCVR